MRLLRRSPLRRGLPGLLLALALVLADSSGALAYFLSAGTVTARATVGTINGPSNVTAAQAGSDITVTWTPASLSTGDAVDGYRVTRSDGTTVCGSPTLVTTASCTDSAVPAAVYTYTVTAVYHSWDAAATSNSVAVLASPALSSTPPASSTSASASFSFSGGGDRSYKCQLDGAAFTPCTSPAAYSGLADGSHTFKVHVVSGTSAGPDASYTWRVDTSPPAQVVTLASGARSAYLTGSTLYYKGNAPGSFKLLDTVFDSGSGPASASFPGISATGWTHPPETVTAPSGGPYTSSGFSWTVNPGTPAGYTVTAADSAGNTASTSLTFVNDSTGPTFGALTVNGTPATSAGSTSVLTNSTSFAIDSRTDYTDGGSGLRSSVLTVQSESLSDSTCGVPGSGGPFISATAISGTSQPSGIQAGYCYLYTLTGTDNVGNVTSTSTTVVDNAVSFQVSTQPSSATAGVATSAGAITLTAIKNGVTDTGYTGPSLTWSGASNSPSGTAPTLPTNPTWSAGKATFGITLVKAETETLAVSDGTRSATFTPIVVGPDGAAAVAWTSVSSPAGVPANCVFTCTYPSGFGNGQTWTASLTITDSVGNTVSNLGAGHSVALTVGGSAKGSLSTTTLGLPSSGPATTAAVTYTSVGHGNYSDTLTAAATGFASATASFSR